MVDFVGSCIALVGCSESDGDRLIHQQPSPTEEQNPRRMEVIGKGSRERDKYGYRRARCKRRAGATNMGDKGSSA